MVNLALVAPGAGPPIDARPKPVATETNGSPDGPSVASATGDSLGMDTCRGVGLPPHSNGERERNEKPTR